MLFEVKERLEGLKYNIDFGGRGWGYTGKGVGMFTMQKGAILKKCLNTLSLLRAIRVLGGKCLFYGLIQSRTCSPKRKEISV